MGRGLSLVFIAALVAGYAEAGAGDRGAPGQSIEASPILKSMDGGSTHTLLLKADGTVWGVGYSQYGEVGSGSTTDGVFITPIQVDIPGTAVAVAAGNYHSLALMADGSVWAWGRNAFGEVGNGSTDSEGVATPTKVFENAVAISAGGMSSYAIKSDGTLWAWGVNDYGQLGDGTTEDRLAPVQVATNISTKFVGVSGGQLFALAVGEDGKVYSWGANGCGMLGQGYTSIKSPTPAPVKNITNATAQIAAGDLHANVILSTGEVYSWGSNAVGQLGDGTRVDSSVPVKMINLTSAATMISTGQEHVLIGLADNKIMGTGEDSTGQLGNGPNFVNSYHLAPIQILNVYNAKVLGTGNLFSLFAVGDGYGWGCGYNVYGQINNGHVGNRYVPVQMQAF